MKNTKQLVQEAYTALKDAMHYKNKMQAPRITKVVVSSGTGSGMKKDRNRNDLVIDRLTKITGQKPSVRGAKQSVASFKIRQGDPIGVMITLRGSSMYNFIDKLVHIALPRTKDFRGIPRSGVNEIGNMTFGIKEHTIFPETSDEDIRDVFGMAVTIATTAKSRAEGLQFFEYLGFPLKKEDEKKKKTRKKKK
jgi:large subunit ribosomal protein L5